MNAENAQQVSWKLELHTKGDAPRRASEWEKHKEHFPMWAAPSDARRQIKKCHLSLLGHWVQELLIHPRGPKFTGESKCKSQGGMF